LAVRARIDGRQSERSCTNLGFDGKALAKHFIGSRENLQEKPILMGKSMVSGFDFAFQSIDSIHNSGHQAFG